MAEFQATPLSSAKETGLELWHMACYLIGKIRCLVARNLSSGVELSWTRNAPPCCFALSLFLGACKVMPVDFVDMHTISIPRVLLQTMHGRDGTRGFSSSAMRGSLSSMDSMEMVRLI